MYRLILLGKRHCYTPSPSMLLVHDWWTACRYIQGIADLGMRSVIMLPRETKQNAAGINRLFYIWFFSTTKPPFFMFSIIVVFLKAPTVHRHAVRWQSERLTILWRANNQHSTRPQCASGQTMSLNSSTAPHWWTSGIWNLVLTVDVASLHLLCSH